MALRLGDPTALDAGRLTLNPIPHIDPFGSIIVPLMAIFSGGHYFIGWAKPVPVNPMNFRNYRRDDILVSVIGPVSNFIMAFVCTVVTIVLSFALLHFRESDSVFTDALYFLLQMFSGGITLNVMLGVFNLIPIPPLDGSHVLASFLPPDMSDAYRRIGFFGIFIIMILLMVPSFNLAFQEIIRFFTIPFALFLHAFIS